MTDTKTTRRSRSTCSTSLFVLATALGATPLYGQAAASAPAAPTVDVASAEVLASDIIVTGTRLAQPGFKSPTPTTIVGTEDIQLRAAVGIADVLFELPSVTPTLNSPVLSQAGGNFVNLRDIGNGQASASRTLVLVDGHRFVPTNTFGQVDINVVPTSLIERIDIVTGGASAAYGSDAIGGVVNIILKKKLEGLQGNLQYGVAEAGDTRVVSGSLAGGTSFAEQRGQILVAGEYSKLSDPARQSDRAWSASRRVYSVNTAHTFLPYNATFDRVVVGGATQNSYTPGGIIVSSGGTPLAATSPLYGRQFLSATASSAFNYGTILPGTPGVSIGGDGAAISDFSALVSPTQRQAVYARASYEFTPAITGWVDASYLRTQANFDQNVNTVAGAGDTPIEIRPGNPYIPADIAAIIAANPSLVGRSFYLNKTTPELGPLHTNSVTRVLRGAAGLDGKIGEKFTWAANYTHGETRFATDLSGNIIESNLRAALDVVVNPLTGRPDCRINVTPAVKGDPAFGAAAGCMPANPFGPGSLANVKSYIVGTLSNIVNYKQDAAAVSVQGSPLDTWAGPVAVAVGAEYRHESVNQAVSPYSDFLNPPVVPSTSPLFRPAFAAGGFQQANPKTFATAVTVKEGFGELAVPLLRDSKLGRSLSLNGAVRYTDYSTSGNVVTWKVGGTYEPVTGVLFRAVRSRDIRAASLFEQGGFAVQSPTINERAPGAGTGPTTLITLSRGNPTVKPEKADTLSAGISLTRLIPGFDASADYYQIDLKDSIGQLGGQAVLDSCYGVATAAGLAPDPTRCALIDRTAGTVTNPYFNLGTVKTKGVDLEAGYRLSLAKLGLNSTGAVSLRVLATYIDSLLISATGLNPVDRAGDISGGGAPHWRVTATGIVTSGRVTITAQGRYIGPLDRDKTVTAPTAFENRTIPAFFYLNLGAQVRVFDRPGHRVELYVNVNNAFDRDPPLIPGTNGYSGKGAASYTNAAFYDVVGRAYTAGFRFKY